MNIHSVINLIESNNLLSIEEMKSLLLKVADNILKDPDGKSYRTLKKDNLTVSKKILAMAGGREMISLMGFEENTSEFVFVNSHERIKHLREIRQILEKWTPTHRDINKLSVNNNMTESHKMEMLKPIQLPPVAHKFTNPFLRQITEYFHEALAYNIPDVKANARSKIPIETIQKNALKKLRTLQKSDKSNLNVSLQEIEMVELLKWFKNDFFSWVDSPECHKCGNETKFTHLSTDEKMMIYTKRIEMYRCKSCGELTPFPRYNDLNILLETRKGRCGEWANVFTLMCVAMGWDARYVLDKTDHVWTEVYSHYQQRWIHCDPCDNICDTPLIYEHGWKKELSYIIAYSFEDIQDVTWRYSSNHKELMKRRKDCSESELVDAIVKLRNERLKTLKPARRKFLLKRTMNELAELLLERQPRDEEKHGRTSGSLNWRIARGEFDENWTQSSFEFFDEHLANMKLSVRYSCSLDQYETSGCQNGVIIENWHQGIYDQKNMMRKEEYDWKQVYLCREEGSSDGLISWRLELKNTLKKIATVSLKIDQRIFENGEIIVRLKSENTSLNLPLNEKYLTTTEFKGSQNLLIEARLSGGKGAHGWQHAQLFRQALDSTEYPFEVLITLFEEKIE